MSIYLLPDNMPTMPHSTQELQRHPKPDGIILLAGSNDVMACTGSEFHWLHVHLKRQLTGPWSKQQYIDQMTAMLDSVAQVGACQQATQLTARSRLKACKPVEAPYRCTCLQDRHRLYHALMAK